MGKLTQRQRVERDDRTRRGLDPYYKWAKPKNPMFFGQGFTQADRSHSGLEAGRQGKSAVTMAWNVRVANYLGLDPETVSPATDISGLTSVQRRRINRKLQGRLRAITRASYTRTRLADLIGRRRARRATASEQQAAIREAVFTAQPDPRLRAADRADRKRERAGTHGYR